jgi:hypothetical protein
MAKTLGGLLLLAGLAVAVPSPALAGSASDAALGLGAFAVLNQILSGTGLFGAAGTPYREVVVAPPPVVVQRPPVVIYTPPPAVVYAPPPPVVYAPPPSPVVVYPPAYVPYAAYDGHYYGVRYWHRHHDDD